MDPSAIIGAEATAPAIGTERLLGVPEICEITGFCPVTAATFMRESGRCIRVHKRLFILESSLYAYIRELEEAHHE